MKTRTLLLLLIPIFLFSTPTFAQDWLAGEKISLRQSGGAITVSLPFENTSEEPFVGDISISLLDKNYKSQAEVFKKLFVVNGRHVEQIALPLPQGYDDRPLVRIDFEDQIWIKRPDPQAFDREMHIIGQKEWLSGSVATIRVIVTQSLKNEPLENVVVNAKLYPQGKDEPVKTVEQATDQSGNAALKFDIDDKISGKYRLVITSEANEQTDKVESSIEVLPGRKIFLVSDKPVYQPGQVMHLRALAAHKSDDRPIAGEEVTLEVFDGKGNKVFKKSLQTSEFGIVSADFQLADEVNQGDYAIKALMGDDVTEKTVNVYEYVLPKFKVSVKNEKDFYLPGDTVEGTVEARYFFGKALDGAHVKIVANCFDVGVNAFDTVEGETDKEGKYKYTFTIPKRLVGQPSFQGKSIIQMDVRVRDTADHEEQKIHTFHVAEQPLQFEMLPESGRLVAGVENEIFIVASRPDGSVAKPKVELSSPYSKKQTVQCDENGIASVFLTPDAELKQQEHFPLTVTAKDNGKTVKTTIHIPMNRATEDILVRPDKGVYQVGDKMELTVLAPGRADGTVFVDIVKNNQTVLTHTVRLSESRRVNVPIDNALIGTLAINAYIVRSDGNMIRDTRQVVAVRADDLHIEITPNEEEYVPGQPASIKIAVSDPQGNPVQAALGMHIVDESVYSLTEKEPGLAKVFFAIEKELLKPKVEIHGFKMDKVVRLSTKKFKEDEKLSKALLSKVDAHSNFGLNINTANTKVQKAQQDINTLQRNFFIQNFTVGTEPRSVEEIVIRNAKDPQNLPLLDPWNNPYVVYAGENQRILFASLGRDAQFETGDDIKQTSHRFILERRKRGQVVEKEFEVLERLEGVRKNNLFFGEEAIRLGDPMRGEGKAKGARASRWREDTAVAASVQARPVDQQQRHRFLFKAKPAPPPPPARPNMAEAHRGVVAFDRAAGVRGPQAEAAGFGGGMVGDMYGMEMKADGRKLAEMDGDGLALNSPEQQQSWYYYSDDYGRNLELGLETTSEERSDLDLDFSMPDLLEDQEGPAQPLVVNGKINEKALEQTALAYIDKKLRQEEMKSSETRKDDVRVRRYFPETLFYTPELITDAKGEASVSLAMADSITTWRMSAMANAKSGAIGDATSAMKVFKPFFIDLDLPIALIQNDEVTIPVAIYNYLPSPQNLKIELEPSPWFKLLEGDLKREVEVAANEVTSVSYRIKASELGEHPITVYAFGSKDSDAIGRQIEVRPNGEAKFLTQNGHLKQPVETKIEYPEDRIAGADQLFVKIYPGLFSQIVEGLDAILKMPHGCFEQTSSTTYPNVLALEYMRATERVTPAIEMKALEYINLGYQRLLTFEIDGGGFQVFGRPPATRVLTAYGLMEFSDMSRVYPIDKNVIERAQRWLIGQRNQDGSWDPDPNYAHAEMWRTIQDNKILSTAYIALGLAQSGLTQGLDQSKNYLFAHADEADDAYTLSILCNTLLALDPEHAVTRECMGKLIEMATIEGDKMFWEAEASMSFARGKHAWVETTAWAALAMIESGRFPNELGKALNWIIAMKDPNGTWGTTHGTVLALKALVRSLQSRTEKADAVVTIRVNDEEAAKVQITPENSDIFRSLDITRFALERNNKVEIDFQGEGNLLYQVVGKYFVPWDKRKLERKAPFAIDVNYDRTKLRRNDTVTCNMTAQNTSGMRAEMVMIDLGIPPGFRVEQSALDDYQKDNVIEKYTIMSRQLLIYLEYLEGNQEIQLKIPMKATLPIVAKAPESTIYEYYNPENKKISQPRELIVE